MSSITNSNSINNFVSWRRWLIKLPWSYKWFIYLVLLKPFLDLLYFLKDISIFISPLYLIGGITPILILLIIFTSKRKLKSSSIEYLFKLWFSITLFNLLLVYTQTNFIDFLGIFLRLVLPFFIYFFYKRLLIYQVNFDGLLRAFFYSSFVPILLFYVAILTDSGNIQLSRGFERQAAFYADVANLGIYVNIVAILLFYSILNRSIFNIKLYQYAIFFIALIFILFKIYHFTSWLSFAGITALFLFKLLRKGKILVLFIFVGFSIFVTVVLFERIQTGLITLVNSEVINIAEGDNIDSFGHGRIGKWKYFIEFWNQSPLIVKFLGIPLKPPYLEEHFDLAYWLLGGVHNDFLRVLFVSGYIGLFCYMLILVKALYLSRKLKIPEKYLFQSSMVFLLFYSMALNPLLYSLTVYFIISNIVNVESKHKIL